MEYIDHKFTLDILNETYPQISIRVKRGDTLRRLVIGFTEGRRTYGIPQISRAVLSAKKPDGTALFDACTIADGKTVIYEFTDQTASAVGAVSCEVRLYGANDKIVTAPKFVLIVEDRVIDDDEDIVLSDDEKTALDQIMLAEAERVAAEEQRILNELNRGNMIPIPSATILGWFDSAPGEVVPPTEEDEPVTNIPAYVSAEADRVSDLVRAKLKASSLMFIAASDFHVAADTATTSSETVNTRLGLIDTGYGFAALQNRIAPDFAAILGDVTYGPGNYTCEKVKADMSYAKSAVAEGLRGLPQMWLCGNHDINYGKGRDRRMNETELYAYLGSNSVDVVTDPDNVGRMYGYRDFAAKRVRVLYLNTSDVLDTPEPATTENAPTGFFSPEQLTFMINALKLSDKTDSDKWGIVILSHYPIMWINEGAKLMQILEAYRGGGSGSVTVTVNGTANTVPYDFTSVTQGELIANIHGHAHNFAHGKMSSSASVAPWLTRVAVPQVMFGRYNESATNSDTSWAEKWGEFDGNGNPIYHYKTANSAKNTSFNVMIIDRDTKIIHAICYGAGVDREIGYGDAVITYRSITNTLTNITTNNNNTQIANSGAYTATLTPADGYLLGTVTVTMGGVDITASAYSSGRIYIASVTGDIVITASGQPAEVYPEYSNNAIPTSTDTSGNVYNGIGYKDGKYASGSAFADSTDANFFVTGLIPYAILNNETPQTIYVKGALWTQESHARFQTFKSDMAQKWATSGADTFGTDSNPYFTVTVIDEAAKYWKIEPKMNGVDSAAYLNFGQTDYIRMSLRGKGAAVCISIGQEPIEVE